MNTPYDVRGRHVLITGASSGIGRALALKLAERGARLTLVARRAGELSALAEQITSAGGAVHPLPADITSRARCQEVVQAAAAHFGPIDVLVNNAGRADQGLTSLLDDDTLEEMMALNARAPLYLIQAVLPAMRARDQGHIVNVITHAAFHGFALTPGYVMAKCALHGLTLNLRYELCDTAIDVTGVYPGLVDTHFAASMAPPGATPSDFMAYMRQFRAGQRASAEFKRIEVPQRPEAVAACIVDAIERPGQLEVFPQEVHRDSALKVRQDPQWWWGEARAFYGAFLVPLREMMGRFVELSRAGRTNR